MPASSPLDTKTSSQNLSRWIESAIGGKLVSLTQQNRWRPAWFAELETDGKTERLYARGARTRKTAVYPLDYEYQVLNVLGRHGIPVPRLYGLCPDPHAIVMELVAGRPDLSTAESEAERESVMDHYIEILAKVHAIDVVEFEKVGMDRPVAPKDIALNLFGRVETMYRSAKSRPDPLLEFIILWVHRNIPQHRQKVSLVCGDPAQFMFDQGRVTSLLDFELAHLGDPLHDLAGLQLRNTSEPLGNIPRALRRYVELTGTDIDEEAFDFHTIQFAAVTPLSLAATVARPLPSGDIVQYMEWFIHLARMPLELIARREGVALPDSPKAEARPTRYSKLSEGLIGAITAIPVSGSYEQYQRSSIANLAVYLHRLAEFGPAFEQQNVDDANALLGTSFDTWLDADTALEKFVLQADKSFDKVLIPLLCKRNQRQQILIEPLLSRPHVAQSMRSYSELMKAAG